MDSSGRLDPPAPIARPRPTGHDRRSSSKKGVGRTTTVTGIMSPVMLSIETSESLWDAWQLMFVGGMRHIAVMDQDICRGVLSDRTVLTDLPVSPDSMRARSVGDAMHTANSQMVGPTTLVCDAALLMAQAPCDALAVIDSEHRVLGVLTSDDIVRWVAAGGGCAEN